MTQKCLLSSRKTRGFGKTGNMKARTSSAGTPLSKQKERVAGDAD
jgi:hypothetical protein